MPAPADRVPEHPEYRQDNADHNRDDAGLADSGSRSPNAGWLSFLT
jgi:hypothetical protein